MDRGGRAIGRHAERGVPAAIAEYSRSQDLELWSYPSAEAQAAAIADDIAYDAHDIDDGLRAELFRLSDLFAVPVIADILRETDRQHPRIDPGRRAHELVRRLITRMIEDVIEETRRRAASFALGSAAAVRAASAPVVGFSPAMAQADRAIKDFLYPRMYRHPRVMRIMGDAENVVRHLFGHYAARPDDLPAEWSGGLAPADDLARARRIADFIAGMTDRYAMVEHGRLFGFTPELR
jgi:dGTPase